MNCSLPHAFPLLLRHVGRDTAETTVLRADDVAAVDMR
jgi:hypothetical protein